MSSRIQGLETLLDHASTAQERVIALNALAEELRDTATQRGLALAQSAFELAQANHDQAGIAHSLVNLGYCHFRLGQVENAQTEAVTALQLFEEIQDRRGQAEALLQIGVLYWRMADLTEALTYALRALAIVQEIGERRGEADALRTIGCIYKDYDETPASKSQAVATLQKAQMLYRELGDREMQARVLNDIAVTHYNMRDYAQALDHARESLQTARVAGSQRAAGYALSTMGEASTALGEYEKAQACLEESLAIARACHLAHLEMVSLRSLGDAFRRQKQIAFALLHIQQGLVVAEVSSYKREIFQCYQMLADIHESQGDLASALACYKRFHSVKENVFNERSDLKFQHLAVRHRIETARKEAEIFQLRTIDLEQQIAERKQAEAALSEANALLQAKLVEIESLQNQLREQAIRDPLTNLYNRRHLDDLLKREFARARREGKCIVLAIIDIDHFKQINDTWGHQAGDLMLQDLAAHLISQVRESDLVCRYGGEEFVWVFLNISLADAYKRVEESRLAIESMRVRYADGEMKLTVSVGLASFPEHGANSDRVLESADQALYLAKVSGRNRVMVAPSAQSNS